MGGRGHCWGAGAGKVLGDHRSYSFPSILSQEPVEKQETDRLKLKRKKNQFYF